MQKILVIGATGFLGGRLAKALLADGHAVRCLARKPARAKALADAGCEVVQGDISDPASVQRAMASVEAVYISIHTLSPQPGSAEGQGFMDVEMEGLHNVVAACEANDVRRVIYVTSLGVAPDAASTWTQGRWRTEQFLLHSGLDVTVIRPGQIVGIGGHGFDAMIANAQKRVALNLFGGGRQKMRNIAVSDLVYYLIGVLDDPRAYGQAYDVGCDEVLTSNQMTDVAADVLGKRHPIKIDVPRPLMRLAAPHIERMAKLPEGALRGLLGEAPTDLDGDPLPIRAILPRQPLPYREAVQQALNAKP